MHNNNNYYVQVRKIQILHSFIFKVQCISLTFYGGFLEKVCCLRSCVKTTSCSKPFFTSLPFIMTNSDFILSLINL